MSIELTIGLIIIGVASIFTIAYVIYRAITKKKDSDSTPDSPPGPSPVKTTIVIDENGSSLKTKDTSTTETYIDFPRLRYCRDKDSADRYSYCNDITIDSGADYVYDPDQGYIDTKVQGGSFNTDFDLEKYLCPDGTTDCVYEDIFNDSGDTVIGIKNSKGEDLIEKMKDDIWSGKIDINKKVTDPENSGQEVKMVELMLRMIDYDEKTGILRIKRTWNGVESSIKLIPGATFENVPLSSETFNLPVGTIIIYILFYYYANGLAKPEIELNIKQEKKLGKLWTEKYNTPSQ